MVFPLFFLYNKNAAIEPPPKTAAEFAAEMQVEKMEICKISLEKWVLSRIIRQTDSSISLFFFPAYNQNFITPFQGARCVHSGALILATLAAGAALGAAVNGLRRRQEKGG